VNPVALPRTRQTLESDIARWAEEAPAAEETAGRLAAELAEAEGKLEGLLEGIKGEVEGHHQALSKVRLENGCWTLINQNPKLAAGCSSVLILRIHNGGAASVTRRSG
jgi:hypothetical protein